MATPKPIRLCWICGNPVEIATCRIDEYGEAVHETCHTKSLAILAEGARKGPTVAYSTGKPNKPRYA